MFHHLDKNNNPSEQLQILLHLLYLLQIQELLCPFWSSRSNYSSRTWQSILTISFCQILSVRWWWCISASLHYTMLSGDVVAESFLDKLTIFLQLVAKQLFIAVSLKCLTSETNSGLSLPSCLLCSSIYHWAFLPFVEFTTAIPSVQPVKTKSISHPQTSLFLPNTTLIVVNTETLIPLLAEVIAYQLQLATKQQVTKMAKTALYIENKNVPEMWYIITCYHSAVML